MTNQLLQDRTRAYVIVAMLVGFMLMSFVDKAVLGLSAVQIMEELDITPGAYGLVASSFFLLFSISAFLVGLLTNRLPTRWILAGMMLVWAAAQLPMLLPIAGFWTLLLTRVLLGFGEGPGFGVVCHSANKWFINRDRDVVNGVLSIGAPLGVIVAAPVLGWVISEFGWRIAFGVSGCVGLLWAAVWVAVGREGPIKDRLTGADAEADETTAHTTIQAVPTWRILLTGTWLSSAAGACAVYWTWALLIAWIPPYLSTVLGYDAQTTGALVTLPWAASAVTFLVAPAVTRMLLARGISSRWARGVLSGACVISGGIALLAMGIVETNWAKITLFTTAFALCAAIFPMGQATNAEISPSNRRGGVNGAWVAAYSLAGVVAPVLTGWLIGSSETPAEGYRTGFTINGVLLIVSGILAASLMRPGRDRGRLAELAKSTARVSNTRPAPRPVA